MRRGIRDASVARSSPRVSAEDMKQSFPHPVSPGAAQEAATVEELLVIDGLRRALRVLEELLQGRVFFGGPRADAVDAVVFARLAVLFSVPLPGTYSFFHFVACAWSMQHQVLRKIDSVAALSTVTSSRGNCCPCFSLCCSDRRELQAILSNRGALLQYCQRLQADYKVWPAGPSFLFGVLSLSDMTAGTPLRVHSWRQRRGAAMHGGCDDQQEAGLAGDVYRLLWWLGAAATCAALLVIAGKTPFRVARVGNRGSPELANEDNEDETDVDEG